MLVATWRSIESRAEAEADLRKRLRRSCRAEDRRRRRTLQLLDKRRNLISLASRRGPQGRPLRSKPHHLAERRDPDSKDSKDWPEIHDPETASPLPRRQRSGCIIEPNWC